MHKVLVETSQYRTDCWEIPGMWISFPTFSLEILPMFTVCVCVSVCVCGYCRARGVWAASNDFIFRVLMKFFSGKSSTHTHSHCVPCSLKNSRVTSRGTSHPCGVCHHDTQVLEAHMWPFSMSSFVGHPTYLLSSLFIFKILPYKSLALCRAGNRNLVEKTLLLQFFHVLYFEMLSSRFATVHHI